MMVVAEQTVRQGTKGVLSQAVGFFRQVLAHGGVLQQDAVDIDPTVRIEEISERDVIEEW